jgi:nucleoid-associated protein YgaU
VKISRRYVPRCFLGCGLLLASLTTPLAAQTPGPDAASPPLQALPTIGGNLDEWARLSQLLGATTADGYLVRSPSSRLVAADTGAAEPVWWLLVPELTTTWNSRLPVSLNEGALRAARGLSAHLVGGASARHGRFFLVVAPELVFQENRAFDLGARVTDSASGLLLPWRTGRRSIDLPLRFGDRPLTRLEPGQSTVGVLLVPVSVGASSESQWWGPGLRNAIVMSNNAPGFPHLFVRTDSPVHTAFGSFGGRWIAGVLDGSGFPREGEKGGGRSLGALALTFTPRGEPGLTLGAARAVQSRGRGAGTFPAGFGDVLLRWPTTDTARVVGSHSVSSLFGRWIFPDDGFEVYAEWSRLDRPTSLLDLLLDPGRTQGYVLGLQRAWTVGPEGVLRLQGELTSLEQDEPGRRGASFYTSPDVTQGYTHRGQVLGAGIGPGSSSQWLAADYVAPRWQLGAFVERIRLDNDAYYEWPAVLPYLGHDVSTGMGLRGGYRWEGGLRIDGEASSSNRMNFLFQNWAENWYRGDNSVDFRNLALRLRLSWYGRAAAPAPGPAPVPVSPAPAVEPTPARRGASELLPSPVSLVPALPVPAEPDYPQGLVVIEPRPEVRGSVEPSPEENPAPAERTGPITHRVVRGETLFGIARRYRVTVDEIRALNRLTGDRIGVGQTLVIPPPSR